MLVIAHMTGSCPGGGSDGARTRPCGAAPPVDSDGLLELGPFPPPGNGMGRHGENSDADSRTLALLCCQPVDNTPNTAFQSSNSLSTLGGSPSCETSPYHQNGWKVPCHTTVMQSEVSPPKSSGSSACDVSQSLQDDNSPDLVVRSSKLGPPLWLNQRHRRPPRRPLSHATNTPFKTTPRTSHVPGTTSSWRCQGDNGPDSSGRSNEGANTWQARLASETTWRHQNHRKPPSRIASSSYEMELTMSHIWRICETNFPQEDATPPLHQLRHSSWAPASHRITEAPSPGMATAAGFHCQEANDNTPDIPLRYNNTLGLPRQMIALRRHSTWAPSSHGIARLSDAAAPNGSRCQDEGSDDNAPDSVIRYKNRLGSPPRMMAQLRQSFQAPRSSCLVGSALTKSSTAVLPAKQWPYSLSNEDLWKGAATLDTHGHLGFIFNKFGHRRTFAKFRLEHWDTSPDCYKGRTAYFCNPAIFKEYCTGNEAGQLLCFAYHEMARRCGGAAFFSVYIY